MNRHITQLLDRLVIRMACAKLSRIAPQPARAEEGRQLLQRDDFFNAKLEIPVQPTWTSSNDFSFPSAVKSRWPENNIVHGKFFRVDESNRPCVILIHGWNDDLGYHFRHWFQKRLLLRKGFNVAMLELPYHLKRRPKAKGAVRDFLSEDLFNSVQATQQAVSDIRALISWLVTQQCGAIGLWGVSLGGWLSGLVSCHEPLVNFTVMNVPVTRMDRVIKELEFCSSIRRSLKENHFDFEKLNLRSHQPKIAPDRMLIVEAVDDLFASKEAIEELWQSWKQPEIWRIPHAHISGLFSLSMRNRTVKWISEKTGA